MLEKTFKKVTTPIQAARLRRKTKQQIWERLVAFNAANPLQTTPKS